MHGRDRSELTLVSRPERRECALTKSWADHTPWSPGSPTCRFRSPILGAWQPWRLLAWANADHL